MHFFSFFNILPSAPTTTGMTLMLIMFYILLISLSSSWYLSIFPFSFSLTHMCSGIAISIMAQLPSFLFTRTLSGFLALISLSHWIITSHRIFSSSFSTTPSGACSHHFSLLFRLYSPHNFQWTIFAFLQHYCVFSCTPFVPTFHIHSQYEISFHFSCHTFYKVLFYLSSVSHSLFELLVIAQHTRLLFQLSSHLFSASNMFLFHLFFLAFLLQIVHAYVHCYYYYYCCCCCCCCYYYYYYYYFFFKVDFCITFYNYKKPVNVNLPRKLEKISDTKRFSNSFNKLANYFVF